MSIKRFVGPNGRETMAQVRRELGVDALVLSTRKLTGGRIEVLAAAPAEVEAMIEDAQPSRSPTPAGGRVHAPASGRVLAPESGRVLAPESGRVLAPESGAGTESFEDFLKRQSGAQQAAAAAAKSAEGKSFGPVLAGHYGEIAAAKDEPPAVFRRRATASEKEVAAAPEKEIAAASAKAAPEAVGPQADARLLAELQSMRALLLEQMATMNSSGAAAEPKPRSTRQLQALTRLLTAGFSPEVARQISERAPQAATPAEADRWLREVLALNIRCAADWPARGGIYALVGPTGVGKTTTAAKLAARFAVRHGAHALGLITLDAFRVGAHEQLRTYGRILGAPVHLAQDAAALRELLASMANRKLVLIDTCGVSQRDERLAELRTLLTEAAPAQRPIEQVLLLNATAHAETLDDVARAWKGEGCAGTIITKLDEAARVGGALDCVLRHRFAVLGATNGQRVPEDWIAADSRMLATAALKPGSRPFTLAESDAAVLTGRTRAAALVD